MPEPLPDADGDPLGDAPLDQPAQELGDSANAPPPYPPLAIRRGWEGVVLLDVEVLVSGKVGSVKLLTSSGHGVLDRAALAAVIDWTYAPALQDGLSVTSHTTQSVRFQLED